MVSILRLTSLPVKGTLEVQKSISDDAQFISSITQFNCLKIF